MNTKEKIELIEKNMRLVIYSLHRNISMQELKLMMLFQLVHSDWLRLQILLILQKM